MWGLFFIEHVSVFLSSNPWCDSFLSFSRSGPINSVFYEQNFNTDQNFCKSQLIIWYTIINQGYVFSLRICVKLDCLIEEDFGIFLLIKKNQFCGENEIFLFVEQNLSCWKINSLLWLLQQHVRLANSVAMHVQFWVTSSNYKKKKYIYYTGEKITLNI